VALKGVVLDRAWWGEEKCEAARTMGLVDSVKQPLGHKRRSDEKGGNIKKVEKGKGCFIVATSKMVVALPHNVTTTYLI
jgi:hypothetical protein